LLALVLDGLDDLYDQRFGGLAGCRERDERAEAWLMGLLISVGVALQGSTWETQRMGVVTRIQELLRTGVSGPDLNDAVLDATDDLRHAIAADL
jgi:hypothetical protein